MSYVYERDGIAAYPDDPGRTGDPEEISLEEQERYESNIDMYSKDMESQLWSVMNGTQDFIRLDAMTYQPSTIIEYLRDSLNSSEFMLLVKASVDSNFRTLAKDVLHSQFAKLTKQRAEYLALEAVRF